MTKRPYHIARQEHLGDVLDALVARKLITAWRWDYDVANRRALYWITEAGRPEQRYETKPAERLALRYTSEHGSTWMPVAHPGGVDQLGALPISVDHCWHCGFPISPDLRDVEGLIGHPTCTFASESVLGRRH